MALFGLDAVASLRPAFEPVFFFLPVQYGEKNIYLYRQFLFRVPTMVPLSFSETL